MNILKTIQRMCTQDIVYWDLSSVDGYGRETFVSPVEIKGRWQSTNEIVMDKNGEEKVSMARVFVLQQVTEGGYLYVGTLDDLDSDPIDPTVIDGALRVIATGKTPPMRGTTIEFMYTAHLNKSKNTSI